MNPTTELGYIDQILELQSRINTLLNWAADEGHLEDGCFTFPDGETWWADGKAPQGGQ